MYRVQTLPLVSRGVAVCLVCLLPFLSACGGGGGNDSDDNNVASDTISRADISASGGDIRSADGQLSLTFPPGALPGPTEISIRRLSLNELPDDFDGKNVFSAYELLPSGLAFAAPVQVMMHYDFERENEQNPEGPMGLNLLSLGNGSLENLDAVVLANASDTIFPSERSALSLTGELNHFSILAGQISTQERVALDRVSVTGLPDVVEVGKSFDIKVKLLHPDLSSLEAERVIFIEKLDDDRFDVSEASKILFQPLSNDSDPNQQFVSFGPVTANTPKAEEITIAYLCKKPGFAFFSGAFRYQQRNNEGKFERIPGINGLLVFQYLLCVDNTVTQGQSTLQADKQEPEQPDLDWKITADPIAASTTVGEFIDIKLTEEALFDEQEAVTTFYWLKTLDTNPGIISDPSITAENGTEDISTEKENALLSLSVNETLYITLDEPEKLNTQNFRYECLSPGLTVIGLAVYAQAKPAGLDRSLNGTGYTYFAVTCHADDDKDKISNDEDLCDQVAGIEGQGCPVEKTNAQVRFGCEKDSQCNLNETAGSCSSCTMKEISSGHEVACGSDTVCTAAIIDDELKLNCEGSGDCSFTSAFVDVACGSGAKCSLIASSLSCDADDSESCAVTIEGNNAPISCEDEPPCQITIPANYLDGQYSDYEMLSISASTDGNDDAFSYDWDLTANTDTLSGRLTVTTRGGLADKRAHLLFDPDAMDLAVTPVANPLFTLESATCDPLANVTLDENFNLLVSGGPVSCLFDYQAIDINGLGVFPLPDNASGPRGFSFVPRGALGLPESESYISVSTDTGILVFDPDSGTVPSAGNTRLSFLNDQTESFGVNVFTNPQIEDNDILQSFGPNTFLRQYDPVLEQISFATIGFDTITDMQKLAGDMESPDSIIVNNSRGRIDAQVFDETTSPPGWRSISLVEIDNLQQLSSAPVSAHAVNLGERNCFHPCQGSGAAMPDNCAAQIAAIQAVIASQPSCADFWSPTSCADLYNTASGGQCDYPRTSPQFQVNYGGMVIGITGGSPSEVFLANPDLTYQTPVTVLGEVGNEARRIKCVPGWCAVTSYASSLLTIVQWDSLFGALIHSSVTVGSGPVGIGIKRESGRVSILTTGSQDNSYHLTTFNAADGSELISTRRDAPEGCVAPEAIRWKPDPESDLAIMTCRGSDNYAVIRP